MIIPLSPFIFHLPFRTSIRESALYRLDEKNIR